MMPLPLYDFVCKNGHEFEDLVKAVVKKVNCPDCKTVAIRQLAAPRLDYYNMGLDPCGLPTAGDKWAKMQTQKNHTPTDEASW